MAIFVLVHGAWGGSHGFRPLRRPLLSAGHEVYTPSLTGLGERAHLSSPQVNLTTHVTDLVNVVTYEDLSDIVLLGYSYGGMVVTGALEHIDSLLLPATPGQAATLQAGSSH
jgi:pimeloyl-ACP methyl ester carboxylesterase